MSESLIGDPYCPHDLHYAAMVGYNLKAECPHCRRTIIYDGYAIWYLFHRRGWNDATREVKGKLYCAKCKLRSRRRIRPMISYVTEMPTDTLLDRPTEQLWKKSVRRRRT